MTAAPTTYSPGSWVALAGPECWALVDLAIQDPRIQLLWQALSADRPLLDALEVLTSDGLRSLPGFALVARDGDRLRYVVRRPALVTTETDHGTTTYDDGGATTWAEGTLDDITTQPTGRVGISGGRPAEAAGLPMAAGVTQAGSVLVGSPAPPTAPTAPTPVVVDEAPEVEPRVQADPARYVQLVSGETEDRDALLARFRSEAIAAAEPLTEPPTEPVTESPPPPRQHETVDWDPEQLPRTTRVPPEPSVDRPPAIIDGVPWATSDRESDPPPAPPPVSQEPIPSPVDQLLTSTVDRAALMATLAHERGAGSVVPAVQCPRGHLSAPGSVACRVCGAQVPPQEPFKAPRPVLGRLVLSTGMTVPLDKGVVIGRAPRTDEANPADRPNLVRLIDSEEISRMHASVRVEGWDVLVRDLGSSNGTTVAVPGSGPVRLTPEVDQAIRPGTVVSLADVVTFTFEAVP